MKSGYCLSILLLFVTIESAQSQYSIQKPTHSLSDSVQVAWVSHFGSNLSSLYDMATDVVIDGFGNVYVTGESFGAGGYMDYATVKYNSEGVEQWVVRYNGPADNRDKATAIAIDNSGDIYVTGESIGSDGDYDIMTVKYSPDGVELWAARYNGPGNSDDRATALAVGVSGNIYVTGYSYTDSTLLDYTTIKYGPDGAELWVTHYNGSQDDNDRAIALAVDISGNVYVTGSSYAGITGRDDYATIKYGPDGAELWVAHYDGPGNGYDTAADIKVDNAGNVYVTGGSVGLGNFGPDYATIKYNTDGVEQWVGRYHNQHDLATSLTVDDMGNVYVAGRSTDPDPHESWDYATVKYNSDGEEQWVARYSGSQFGWEEVKSIVIDNSEYIYITGNGGGGIATIKYDLEGVEQWVARTNSGYGIGLNIDINGNVYIAGASRISGEAFDYTTIKYNSAGTEEWNSSYTGSGISQDKTVDLATDGLGNIYVTGISEGFNTRSDYATVKYNSSGDEQWVVRYNGSDSLNDKSSAIAVDGFGNVYVTGASTISGASFDYTTIKYNSDGTEDWISLYTGPGFSYDYATDMAVDGSGNVYVIGYSGPAYSYDYATIKYNPEGVEQWTSLFEGSGNSVDKPTALALDREGNVYVTGNSGYVYCHHGCTFYSDSIVTVKYKEDGVEEWVAITNNGYVRALAVDNVGNAYMAGKIEGHFAVVKYNLDGEEEWLAKNGIGSASTIDVDGLGNSYVAGRLGEDFATVKLNPDGELQWVALQNNGSATSLLIDDYENIYVTGNSDGDIVTIKYSTDGNQIWTARYDGPDNYPVDNAIAIALDDSRNVIVAGFSKGTFGSIYTTIKYIQIPVSVEEQGVNMPRFYNISQNYPNPFNPTTTIKYALPKSGEVLLAIYDLLGGEVTRLVDGEQSEGYHTVTWDASKVASGIYFYRLQAGDFVQTRKMVLLK